MGLKQWSVAKRIRYWDRRYWDRLGELVHEAYKTGFIDSDQWRMFTTYGIVPSQVRHYERDARDYSERQPRIGSASNKFTATDQTE